MTSERGAWDTSKLNRMKIGNGKNKGMVTKRQADAPPTCMVRSRGCCGKGDFLKWNLKMKAIKP